MAKRPKPIVLTVLDGWGYRGNQRQRHRPRRKPNYDRLLKDFPNTLIHTSGPFVGLPEGQMGNSEVGHLNMGAGRIVQMDITRVDQLIASGEFFRQPLLLEAMERGRARQLHLMGLVSDGGVHSHIEHLFALLRMARENKVENVFVHCFMDGRDTPPDSGIDFFAQLEQKMREYRRRPDRQRQRPLLRDGSRQSLGARRESLSRHGARRRGSRNSAIPSPPFARATKKASPTNSSFPLAITTEARSGKARRSRAA